MDRKSVAACIGAAIAVALVIVSISVLASADDDADPASAPGQAAGNGPGAHGPASDVETVEIPDNFPLTAGWPAPAIDMEITGPARGLEPVRHTVCDVVAPDPAHGDRMRADFSSPEDYRTRQLTTYADADEAASAVTDVLDAYRACPQDSVDEAGFISHHEVRQLDVGDESWAILARDTFRGGEAPFGATTIIIRVGTAVLLFDHGGHAGYPGSDAQPGIEATLSQASVPIAAMCTFSRVGCGTTSVGPASAALGPEGFGAVTLGMDRESLLALDGVDIHDNAVASCMPFTVVLDGYKVTGAVEPGLGVSYIFVPDSATTPEGLGPGASRQEVMAVHPDATIDDTLVFIPVPNFDDRHYRGEIGPDGTLGSLSLMHEQQSCGG